MKDRQILKFLKKRGYEIDVIDKNCYGCKNPELSVLFVLYLYEDLLEMIGQYPAVANTKDNPGLHAFIDKLDDESRVTDYGFDEEENAIMSVTELDSLRSNNSSEGKLRVEIS